MRHSGPTSADDWPASGKAKTTGSGGSDSHLMAKTRRRLFLCRKETVAGIKASSGRRWTTMTAVGQLAASAQAAAVFWPVMLRCWTFSTMMPSSVGLFRSMVTVPFPSLAQPLELVELTAPLMR